MKKQPGLRNKVDQLTLQFLATSRDNMELTEWSLRERNKYREQIAHLFHQLHYDDDNTSHVISQIRTEYKNFIRACLHHLKMHERKCHLLANSVEEEEPVPEDDEEGEELELDVDLLDDQTEEVPEELVSPEDDEEACVKKAAPENDPFCLENSWPTFAGDDFGEDEFQRLVREAEDLPENNQNDTHTPHVRTISFEIHSNTNDGCRRRK